jgi:hypothetical protein
VKGYIMNRLLSVALLACSVGIATPAFAGNPNDGSELPGCTPSGETPQKCDGGSVTVGDTTNTNTNVNANVNTNNNANTQGQLQGQLQGQTQSSNNTNDLNNVNNNDSTATAMGGNATATGGNSQSAATSSAQGGSTGPVTVSVVGDRQVRQYRYVAPAYAPTVVASGGNDSCQGSVAGGVGTGVVNLSFGKTTQDNNCRRIKLSRRYEELGMPDVACQILALDPEANEAMRRAGRSCEVSQFVPAQGPTQPASVGEQPVAVVTPGERG